MSVESLAVVLHHSSAKGTALNVLIGIANHDGDGGAWPAVETLAKYGRCSERRVQQIVRALVEAKELDVKYQAGGLKDMDDHRRPNRYEILVRCPDDCDGSKQHRPKVRPARDRTADEEGCTGGVKPIAPPPGEAGFTQTTPEEPPIEPALDLDVCGPDSGRFAPSVGARTENQDQGSDDSGGSFADADPPDYVQRRVEDRELFRDLLHGVVNGTHVKVHETSRWGVRNGSDEKSSGTVRIETLYDFFRRTPCVGKNPMKWPGAFFNDINERSPDHAITDWLTNEGLELV